METKEIVVRMEYRFEVPDGVEITGREYADVKDVSLVDADGDVITDVATGIGHLSTELA